MNRSAFPRSSLPLLLLVAVACATERGDAERSSPPASTVDVGADASSAQAPSTSDPRTVTAGIADSPGEHAQPRLAAGLEKPAFAAPSLGDSIVPGSGNAGYDVQHYVIALALDAESGSIEATTTIDATATQALGGFHLDFHGLEIDSVLVDGRVAEHSRSGDELAVSAPEPIDAGAAFRTVVRYRGVPDGVEDHTLPIPMDIGWLAKDGEYYVFSQPNGAPSFFPCNDHPLDKARVRLELDVPRPLQAVANGRLVETIESETRRTFVWEARDPMATYLVTIAIAEFEEQRIEGPNGLEIVNWFTPESRKGQRADFDKTDEIVAFLADTFGEYPFESCGNVLSNLDIPGALETQTLPVYGLAANDEAIICHEIAHQWFGNSVSVTDWDDIWINEGFAEYAAWMYLESRKGPEALEKHARGNYALARFAGADAPGRVEPKTMFGLGVYVRGPLALHVLRTALGDDAFLALLRSWYERHRNGNASLEQFLEHLRATAPPEVVALLERWLFDATMPTVAAWDAQIEAEKEERAAKRKIRDEERAARKAAREADAETGKGEKTEKTETPPKDG